jgi:uncharacterized protein (TIGR03067 family)
MRRVVPLLIVLSLGFAPAPVYRERLDTRTELEKIQGEWVLISRTCGGQSVSSEGLTLVVAEGECWYRRPDGANGVTMGFRLDTTVEPHAFSAGFPFSSGLHYRGFYVLTGDRLTLCTRFCFKRDRPSTLFDVAKDKVRLEVFTRKKP